jgi:hypothetical protein
MASLFTLEQQRGFRDVAAPAVSRSSGPSAWRHRDPHRPQVEPMLSTVPQRRDSRRRDDGGRNIGRADAPATPSGLGRMDMLPDNDSSVAVNLALVSDEQVDVARVVEALGSQRGMRYFCLLIARLEARGEVGRASDVARERSPRAPQRHANRPSMRFPPTTRGQSTREASSGTAGHPPEAREMKVDRRPPSGWSRQAQPTSDVQKGTVP